MRWTTRDGFPLQLQDRCPMMRPQRQNSPEAFAADLREGHFNELRVALYFMLQRFLVRIRFDEGRYDIVVQPPARPLFHVEVKWDKRAAQTGRLYFEVENTRQQQPSGVSSTTADWWCHVIGEGSDALLVKVDDLRSLLDSGDFQTRHTGGMDSNSRGTLVPRARLEGEQGFYWVHLPTVEHFFGEVFRRGQ